MDKITNPFGLFRKTFLYSVGTVILIGLLFRLYPFLFALFTSNDTSTKEIVLWGISSLYSILTMSLFALIVPWLMLSFYGEWFYTRSFSRDIFFKRIFGEYLKWFLSLAILITASVLIYNYSGATYPIYYRTTFDVTSITLYLAIIMSGNSKTLFKMLKYGFFIVIIMAAISAYGTSLDPYTNNDYSPSIFAVRVVWAMYILLCYKIVEKYDEDLDINVPGKSDDENRSIANMWIFSESKGKKIELVKYKNIISRLYSEFILMTQSSKIVYFQLVFVISVLSFFFGLRFGIVYILAFTISEIYFSGQHTNIDSAFVVAISTLIVLISALIIVANPKYIFIPNEEFLLTRAIKKGKLYISNYLMQGLFISLITLFFYFFVVYNSLSMFDGLFDFTNILISIIWFFIAGEIGIITIIGLIVFDSASIALNNGYISELTSSLFINILTSGYIGISIWLGAIFFRIWDYQNFVNKEIGWFKGGKSLLTNILKNYAPPFLLLNGIILFTAFINPLTKFINLYPDQGYYNITANIYADLFVKSTLPEESTHIIDNSLKNPFSKDNYLKLAEAYVNSTANNITYNLSDTENKQSLEEIYNILRKSSHGKFDRQQDEKKINYWLSLAEDQKNNENYIYLKAIHFYTQKNYKQSDLYAKKTADISNNTDHLFAIGRLYSYMYMNKEAIDIYKKLIKLQSAWDTYIYKRIGDIYWMNGQPEEALKNYSLAANSRPATKENMTYRKYDANNLCNKTIYFVLNNKTKFQDVLSGIKPENLYSICSNSEIKEKYLKNVHYMIDYSKEPSTTGYKIKDYNYARYYLNKNDSAKAEKYLNSSIQAERNHDYGELAMLLAKAKRFDELKTLIKRYKDKVYSMSAYGYYMDNFESAYNYKVYIASMFLDKEDKLALAKKALLTAPDTDKAFQEIIPFFDKSGNDYQQLDKLKNQYNKLYKDLETHGKTSMNYKMYEKSIFLIERYLKEVGPSKEISELYAELKKV